MGKTAFVLGGGGSRGAYEIGVWQALKELGVKIDMVYGTSVGAINACMVAQGDLELTEKLWKELETDKVFDMDPGSTPVDYVKEVTINHGAGTDTLKELLNKYVDEKKIREAGLDYGITCVSLPKYTPHWLRLKDIPEGLLVDYTVASGSAFPLIHSHNINGEEYIDGGYCDAIPIGMAVDDGATEVIAVDLNGFGILRKDDIKRAPNLKMIKSHMDLGMQFIFDKSNTNKIMRWGYLDALKAYGVINGKKYAFSKGDFTEEEAERAEIVAECFELDPAIIYTKKIFLELINEKMDLANEEYLEFKKNSGNIAKQLEGIKVLAKEVKIKRFFLMLVAEDFKEFGDKSIFEEELVRKVIKQLVDAAEWLVNNGVI